MANKKTVSRHADMRTRHQKVLDRLYGRDLPMAVLMRKLHNHIPHVNASAASKG